MGDTGKEPKFDINVMELLIQISKDVASIKTDMTNVKEMQKTERVAISREITEARNDSVRDIADVETRLSAKINNIQSVQNNLVGDVDTLKHKEDEKDAHKWRTVVTYILSTFGGMVLIKIPDFIEFLIRAGGK